MEEMKTLNIRIPVGLWKFLKKNAFDQEVSMNCIITTCLEKYKNKSKKDVDND